MPSSKCGRTSAFQNKTADIDRAVFALKCAKLKKKVQVKKTVQYESNLNPDVNHNVNPNFMTETAVAVTTSLKYYI